MVPLLKPVFRDAMIDHGRWRIKQPFPARKKPAAELGVFASNLRARIRTQIDSESAVFLKHHLSERHVGSERRLKKFSGLWARLKDGERRQRIAARVRQPRRRRETLLRQNASSDARPGAVVENSG